MSEDEKGPLKLIEEQGRTRRDLALALRVAYAIEIEHNPVEAEDVIKSLQERVPDIPSGMLDIYALHPDEASDVIAGKGIYRWSVFPTSRNELFRHEQWFRATNTSHYELVKLNKSIFGSELKPHERMDAALFLWQDLAHKIFFEKDEMVKSDIFETSFGEGYLDDFLKKCSIKKATDDGKFSEVRSLTRDGVDAFKAAIEAGFCPVKKVGDRYEISQEDLAFLVLGSFFVSGELYDEGVINYDINDPTSINTQITPQILAERLTKAGCFNKEKDTSLLLSFIAESVFIPE